MSYTRMLVGVVAVALAAATPTAAQDRAVTVFARGGGFNGLTNLDDAGTADFQRVGYTVGGGLGVQLLEYVSVRADFTFARNELQAGGVETGDRLNRFFYDGALQFQYPVSAAFVPYVFAGGGAVTLHQVGTSGQNETRAAGTFGVGFAYQIPRSALGFFAEGRGWAYSLRDLNGALSSFDKTQVELTWSGGLSYRLPI